MADPTQQPRKMVKSVKLVDVALVIYEDPTGVEHTQFAYVGDQTVVLLDGRGLGYSNRPDPGGVANRQLRNEVLEGLNRSVPQEG